MLRMSIAAAIASLLLPVAGFGTPIWDFANDFTPSANPNTFWSYGYRTTPASTDLTLMNWNPHLDNIDFWALSGWVELKRFFANGLPSIGKNNTPSAQPFWWPIVPPGKGILHPGNVPEIEDLAAVVRWRAPSSGVYEVDATFTAIDTRGVDVFTYVVADGGLVFDDFVVGLGDTSHYRGAVTLSAGQVVDFVVANRNDTGNRDWTQLDASITPIPEPSTLIIWSLLGALGMAAGWWRRRKRAA